MLSCSIFCRSCRSRPVPIASSSSPATSSPRTGVGLQAIAPLADRKIAISPKFLKLVMRFFSWLRRLAAHGNDLHPSVVALALALRHHALELREREMDHPSIPGIHRLERDDLSFRDGLLAQPSSHRCQGVVTAAAVALRV